MILLWNSKALRIFYFRVIGRAPKCINMDLNICSAWSWKSSNFTYWWVQISPRVLPSWTRQLLWMIPSLVFLVLLLKLLSPAVISSDRRFTSVGTISLQGGSFEHPFHFRWGSLLRSSISRNLTLIGSVARLIIFPGVIEDTHLFPPCIFWVNHRDPRSFYKVRFFPWGWLRF